MLTETKDFLRIYDDYSDDIIVELIKAAQEEIHVATNFPKEEIENNSLAKLCVKLLVRHWYDSETEDVPFGIQTIMIQLDGYKQ